MTSVGLDMPTFLDGYIVGPHDAPGGPAVAR